MFESRSEKSRKTIVLIGAGSTYFTKVIVESLCRKGVACDLRLCDIDEKCLDIATKLSRRMIDEYQADITVKGSADRRDLLSDAQAVVSTVGVGGRKAWAKDIFMFHEFGIYQSTGDTFGAGGFTGFLHWGYNYWQYFETARLVDPYLATDCEKAFPAGNPFLVYPGPEEPVPSVRSMVLREAMQDIRALDLCESLFGREKTLKMIDEYAPGLSFTEYPHSTVALLKMRKAVGRKLLSDGGYS